MDLKDCVNQWLDDNDFSYEIHDGCCVGFGSTGKGPNWDVYIPEHRSIVAAPSSLSWKQQFLKGDVVVYKHTEPKTGPQLVAVLNYHDLSFFNKLEEAINGR